jgi:hypothetical protein
MQSPTDIIRNELSPNEHLLWAGQPIQGIKLRPSDALQIPFSIMWGGFAIAWEIGVNLTGAPLLFKLWGIPFVLVGLYMMIGRFFHDAFKRKYTIYGLSSQRVIIITGKNNRTTQSLNLSTLNGITLTEKSNGSGTINFAPSSEIIAQPISFSFKTRNATNAPRPLFELSQDARLVYELLRGASTPTPTNI